MLLRTFAGDGWRDADIAPNLGGNVWLTPRLTNHEMGALDESAVTLRQALDSIEGA